MTSPARRVQRPFQRDQVILEETAVFPELTAVTRESFGRVAHLSQRVEFALQLDSTSGQTLLFRQEVYTRFAVVHKGACEES